MKTIVFLFLIAFSIGTKAQIELNRIGQTPGGSGYHVNYDSLSQRLFVGAGTSLWVYDMSNPNSPIIYGKRPLLGLITETILFDSNTLLVSATFDGVYAIDLSSPDLTIIDHKYVDALAHRAAYDMTLTGDTLLIPNNVRVSMLRYISGSGFTNPVDVGPNVLLLNGNAFCVTNKANNVFVGTQGLDKGRIFVYDKSNLNNYTCLWSDTSIKAITKIMFSDTNDSIFYVCGGSSNSGITSSFLVLKYDGTNITKLDSYEIIGIPFLAAANIQNMDIENDTLYLATGCAVSDTMGLPLSYIPIFDATEIASSPMHMINYINPGLWHFDVSLIKGTPYMATASEWLGVAINNVKSGLPLDTLPFLQTGGWTQKSKLHNNNLWVAHEGWGLAAYNIDSLKFNNGFVTDSKTLHIFKTDITHEFVGDFEFINDTLLLLSSGTVYNIKPWQQGGQPDSLYKLNLSGYLNKALTNDRIIVGTQSAILPDLGSTQKLSIFDPYNPSGNALFTLSVFNNVKSFTLVGDTVFYGFKTDSLDKMRYLVASKIVNNSLITIASIATDTLDHINSISVDGNIVAIGKKNTIMWYSWDGSNFTFIDSYYDINMTEVDVYLKNNYIYVADRIKGLIIIDIDNPVTPVAEFEGRGTWKNLFGSEDIELGNDGTIYLSDFNAGVIMIEAFDTSLSSSQYNIANQIDGNIRIYPNPVRKTINIDINIEQQLYNNVTIYNTNGQIVFENKYYDNKIVINNLELSTGVYYVKLTNSILTEIKKIIIE